MLVSQRTTGGSPAPVASALEQQRAEPPVRQHARSQPLAALSRECVRVTCLGFPLSVGYLLAYSATLITLAFVGHLGQRTLAAAVLGLTIYNTTGLIPLIGLGGAAETMGGQSYGAGNYANVGTILQKSLLLVGAADAIIVILWSQMHHIFLAIGQDPAIAAAASRFLLLLIPALVLFSVSDCFRRFLMTQQIVVPVALSYILSTAAAPLLCWLLMFRWRLGLTGAAIALGIVELVTGVALAAAALWHHVRLRGTDRQSWTGWSMACLRDWGPFTRLALSCLVMFSLEALCYEVVVLLAGLLPEPDVALAAAGVCNTLITWLYWIMYGLADACTVRVSTELGAEKPGAAKMAAWGAVTVTAVTAVCLGAMVLGLGGLASHLFSSSGAVLASAKHLMPLMALLTIGSGLTVVLQGVIRGSGRQSLGAAVNILCYAIVGLPLAAGLAFPLHDGLSGLFTGVTIGVALQIVVLLLLVSYANWGKYAAQAVARSANHALASSTPL